LGAAGDEGIGADDGLGTDDRAIEDGAVHADEAFIADAARVHHGAVAEGGPVANFAGVVVGKMDDSAVLDIGVMADLDEVDIAAQHGVEPHAGVIADRNIAHDNGGAGEVNAFAEGGLATEKLVELGIEFAHRRRVAGRAQVVGKNVRKKSPPVCCQSRRATQPVYNVFLLFDCLSGVSVIETRGRGLYSPVKVDFLCGEIGIKFA
jgi:hypothetical protein